MNAVLESIGRFAVIVVVGVLLATLAFVLMSPAADAQRTSNRAALLKQSGESLSGAANGAQRTEVTLGQRRNLPEGDSHADHVSAYYVASAGARVVGYVLELVADGYSGRTRLIAAYDATGTIVSVSRAEPAGRYAYALRNSHERFWDEFVGTGGDTAIPDAVSWPQIVTVDAVSGATVTFRAAAAALEAGSDFVKTGGGRA